jgi:hypothetical protein
MSRQLIERTLRKARQTAYDKDRSQLIAKCKKRLGITYDYEPASKKRWAQTMWM